MNRGLIAGTLAFFSGFASLALFGTTVLKVGPILKLNLVESSWLVAIPTLTGAFLRIPFSLLVNRLGKWTLFIQLIIGLIGLIGIIFTLKEIYVLPHMLTYDLLLIFGAVAGTSISTFSSGVTYVSYFYPQRKQGTALGIFAGLGNTAPGIFTVILPFALASLGLIYSYISWAMFLAIMIIIYVLIAQCPPYLKNKDEIRSISGGEYIIPILSMKESLIKSVRDFRIWLLVIMYTTSFGGFEALTEWLPTYWKEFLHVSPVVAGLLTGTLYSLLTALIRVLGGWLSDIYSGEKVSLISFSIMIMGSVIFILAYSLPIAVAAEITMGIGMGIANGAIYKLVPKYSSGAVSGAAGLVGGLGSAGGLLIPPIMGYIASISNFPYAFSVFLFLGAISISFSLLLVKKLVK